jgi:hypothetical protein
MKLLHPRAVIDAHVEHAPLDLERLSSRRNLLPNNLRPDREDLCSLSLWSSPMDLSTVGRMSPTRANLLWLMY